MDDLQICARLWGERRETYPSIYPLRLRNPSLSRSTRLEYNVKDLEEELADPLAVFNVATRQRAETPGAEQVVGFAVWQKPGSVEQEQENLEKKRSQPAAQRISDPVAAECDTELAAKLKEESIRIRRRYSESGPLWWVDLSAFLVTLLKESLFKVPAHAFHRPGPPEARCWHCLDQAWPICDRRDQKYESRYDSGLD